MNTNTEIKPAVTLKDKLEQTGHLWAFELEAKVELASNPSKFKAKTNLQYWLVRKLVDWGIESTYPEVGELVASYVR